MPLSLNPSSLKRYYDLVRLFYKYGRGDLVRELPETDSIAPKADDAPPVPAKAEELARDLEALGPTFIKLGQLLSTRPEIIPPSYVPALERLQDDVKTFSFDEVQKIVSDEIGVRLSKAFLEFEAEPIGAASLSQVHRAVTRSGREVVVKVQRPGVREIVTDDLQALSEVAAFLEAKTAFGAQYQLSGMVEELRRSMMRELDYRVEAENMRVMAGHLSRFERVNVPEPLEDLSSGRVLTMQFVRGRKVTKHSPLIMQDVDGEGLADELFRCYLHQVLVAGFFHADPHPGNVFLTEEKTIALLDLGMVAHVGSRTQESLLKLLAAIADTDGDRVADIAEALGETTESYDRIAFRRQLSILVAEQAGASLAKLEIGRLLMDVQQIAAANGLRVPSELSLLGKTLLNLDRVGRTLCPTFDPNESIRRNIALVARERMHSSFSPSSLLAMALETKEVLQKVPARLGQILDLTANNQLRLKVDTIDEHLIVGTLQKIANRITLGLIIAALLIGAALLMRVDTSFRLWGYPGLAMIFFLAATAGAAALAWQILRHDRSQYGPGGNKR
ncbi:MAG: AarF/ABC1/UbiB kinase family protein [Verrucomicrobiaceae bacterium]|nr:AarF/ABC1/UbiB kinase family protein [Verrucomicrobiaceae bacterium]